MKAELLAIKLQGLFRSMLSLVSAANAHNRRREKLIMNRGGLFYFLGVVHVVKFLGFQFPLGDCKNDKDHGDRDDRQYTYCDLPGPRTRSEYSSEYR